MGYNDPCRRKAIAASIGEYEETPEELSWSSNKVQQAFESYQAIEEREAYDEARRIYVGLRQRGETPSAWWRNQNQSSYFSQQVHDALCDIWESNHMGPTSELMR
ncbi:MAG: hypothetical protein H6797_03620 [Candidatus Nomurabacteria bacterium]|nr:MAG: hypothetical protein H6797_03620 [Candidatus Nomurabacteria bacterium]